MCKKGGGGRMRGDSWDCTSAVLEKPKLVWVCGVVPAACLLKEKTPRLLCGGHLFRLQGLVMCPVVYRDGLPCSLLISQSKFFVGKDKSVPHNNAWSTSPPSRRRRSKP